ncbi:hypothetical protein [uncultured Amnibacterium sp.]|uniref:hypothetical protein n=1 Tax=uncultured Amnibacterium sp. TaxID=1631851 RepID=UPI0035CB74DC
MAAAASSPVVSMKPNCVSGAKIPPLSTALKGEAAGVPVEEFMDLTWTMANKYYMGLT